MLKYIALCILLAHNMWAMPVHEHSELAPHVLIVTPQAQVRLDSLIPGTPIIQHLSPVTRLIAPHDETIVYVPATAAAAVPVQYAEIIARSLPSSVARQDTSQLEQQITQIAQIAGQAAAQNAGSLITGSFAPGDINPANILQGALANGPGALSQAAAAASSSAAAAGSSLISGASSFAPGDWSSSIAPLAQGALATAPIALGSAAAAAAAAAGSGFISGFTQTAPLSSLDSKLKSPSSSPLEPSPLPAPALSLSPVTALSDLPSSLPKIEKLQYEIPITPILLTAPHHVDIVQPPILLAPSLTTIQARNLATREKEIPIIVVGLPEILKPEALPLGNHLEKEELIKDVEKKAEFKRFLEANALKEDSKEDALNLNLNKEIKADENQKIEKIDLEKTELELKSVPIVDDEKDENPQINGGLTQP